MPKFTFTDEDVPQFTVLPKGKYQYEVVGFDLGISNGAKTNGNDTMELKLLFFVDDIKAAQWTETLIFPRDDKDCITKEQKDTNQFLRGRVNMFTKSANMLIDGQPPAKNQEVEYTAETTIGLRGWAQVDQKAGTKNPEKKFNYVDIWLTGEEKLARNVPAAAEEENPF
jgi:hypothetical protein